QGDGVDAEVLRGGPAIDAEVDLEGAALDGPADDLLELGLEEVVGVRGAEGDVEVAVVEGPQLDREGQAIALVARLPVAGHTQQHANLVCSGAITESVTFAGRAAGPGVTAGRPRRSRFRGGGCRRLPGRGGPGSW